MPNWLIGAIIGFVIAFVLFYFKPWRGFAHKRH
jgi:hypothetical protein